MLRCGILCAESRQFVDADIELQPPACLKETRLRQRRIEAVESERGFAAFVEFDPQGGRLCA